MSLEKFNQLWNSNAAFAWWQAVLIAFFLFALDCLLYACVWYIHKETILECGYRKARAKSTRTKIKNWPLRDKVLLVRLVREATESSPMLKLCLFLNGANLLCAGAGGAGFLGLILTRGHGWALMLLLCSGLFSIFFLPLSASSRTCFGSPRSADATALEKGRNDTCS